LDEGEGRHNPTGIPEVIRDFFNEQSARSLLVKGASGTGKTTFVLQLMEDVLPLETSIYFSTRVSDEALYSHFKWLKDKEWRESILDASKEMLKVMRATPSQEELEEVAEKREILNASKDFLSTIYPTEDPQRAVQRTRLERLCDNYPIKELEKLYDSLERKLPQRCYVVVDSLEGIAEKWDVPITKVMSTLQKDLVEGTNVCVVAVIEGQGDTSLDFLVDGTLTLHRSIMDEHFIRELEIHKLRGVRLRASRWLFTLQDGHFRLLPPHPALKRVTRGPGEPIPDSNVGFSTGHPALDGILGGGIPAGSRVILEVGRHVPNDVVSVITTPMSTNFLLHERGVMIVPEGGETAEDYLNRYSQLVDPSLLEENMRVAEKINPSRDQNKPYIVALEYQDALKDFGIWDKASLSLRERTGSGPLRILGLETQESRFGAEEIREVISLVSESVQADGGVLVTVAKPGLVDVTQRVANTSNIHLRLARVDNSFVLYGVEPETEILYLDFGGDGDVPLDFVPVV
jgi:KaiC/GvpD/RAD55 family RecA-like ATPase